MQAYRTRLHQRGLARFEVTGLDRDRDLIHALAKRLAESDAEGETIRASLNRTIAGEPPQNGGILAALRRSPLVGADLDLERPREAGRSTGL
jgi:hypothetical protein